MLRRIDDRHRRDDRRGDLRSDRDCRRRGGAGVNSGICAERPRDADDGVLLRRARLCDSRGRRRIFVRQEGVSRSGGVSVRMDALVRLHGGVQPLCAGLCRLLLGVFPQVPAGRQLYDPGDDGGSAVCCARNGDRKLRLCLAERARHGGHGQGGERDHHVQDSGASGFRLVRTGAYLRDARTGGEELLPVLPKRTGGRAGGHGTDVYRF